MARSTDFYSFATMLAMANDLGIESTPAHDSLSPDYAQLLAALSVTDHYQARIGLPCLEGTFKEEGVFNSSATCYVAVPEEGTYPMTIHCGYSENGCQILYAGTLYSLEDNGQFPEELKVALSHSWWPLFA